MSPSYDLQACRERIPVLAETISLANCSHAPRTDEAREAIESYLASWGRDVMDWDVWMEQVDRAKAEFAALIHATPEEVAILPSVTAAAGVVASTFEHRVPRNRVLLSEAEFPTVGHVWLARARHGADVRWVPLRDGTWAPSRDGHMSMVLSSSSMRTRPSVFSRWTSGRSMSIF
jgi:selenocysteine lyase/cysteine desulfurase